MLNIAREIKEMISKFVISRVCEIILDSLNADDLNLETKRKEIFKSEGFAQRSKQESISGIERIL